MSYQVTKKVGSRLYRYEVERVRDPVTGKKKSRWRYLGRVLDDSASAQRNKPPRTPERLLAALHALLRTRSFNSLTVDAVATRAKTTHATFYRYFRNMHDLLAAALTSAQASLPSLDLHVTGDALEEQRKIGDLIESVFEQAKSRSSLLKALIQSRSDSPVLQALWKAHNDRLQRAWAAYITELNQAGLGRNDDPRDLAHVVVLCIQARLHEAILRDRPITPSDSALWATAVARLVLRV